MAKNIAERICNQCGMINKQFKNNCYVCGGDLNTISIKNYFDIKQVILFTVVPLLWFFLISYFFNFFGLVTFKKINPVLLPFRHLLILLFTVSFSYLFIKLGAEWHAVGLTNDGFSIYLGYYFKIKKVVEYRYSDIEIFCKVITPKYVSISFNVENNLEVDDFVIKNIIIGNIIINNLKGKEILPREFEKRFSVITGY